MDRTIHPIKGQAERLDLKEGISLRDQVNLSSPSDPKGGFEVLFDELKLFRPIKYESLPMTSHAIKKPMVFLGKCREEFSKVPAELSSGTLDFEAYLFWTPKVAPVEHQGVLVRIHSASGTLFDSTFMRYQVSEQTRLRQITCEIFVKEGLDSALNIDRESFNNAHPHAVYITRWMHVALRQLSNAQKKLAKEIRDQARSESKERAFTEIQKIAVDTWEKEVDEASEPPEVRLLSDQDDTSTVGGDAYVFKRDTILPSSPGATSPRLKQRKIFNETKLQAIAQVLASYGLLDSITKKKQERLLKAIYQILDASEE